MYTWFSHKQLVMLSVIADVRIQVCICKSRLKPMGKANRGDRKFSITALKRSLSDGM